MLPEYVVIDTRTMKVRTCSRTRTRRRSAGISRSSSRCSTESRASNLPSPKLHDELLTEDEWDLLQDMKLPAAPPVDPTNEYGDVPAAAVLGKKLFDDVSLSPSGTVSCVTCHDPTRPSATA